MPSRRFLLALATSLLLHAVVLGNVALWLAAANDVEKTPAMLDVTLLPPPPTEPLLKDTLAEQPAETPAEPPPVAIVEPLPAETSIPTAEIAKPKPESQRKAVDHRYYPPEAVAAGMEGEVRLLLTLAANGRVLDAQIARSSGFPILDQAAVRAVFAMGAVAGLERREAILPVVFQLRP